MEEKANFINYLNNIFSNYINKLVSLGYNRVDLAKILYSKFINDNFDFSEFSDIDKHKSVDLKSLLKNYMYAVYYMSSYYYNSVNFNDDIMCGLLNSFNVYNFLIEETFLIEEIGLKIADTLINYLDCSEVIKNSMAEKMEQDENFSDALDCNYMLKNLYQVNKNLFINENANSDVNSLNFDSSDITTDIYNEDVIETYIAQEKLNQLCFDSFDKIHPISDIVSKIKNDEQSKAKMIDIIYANYLVDNYNSFNKNKKGVCNYIMNLSSNKELLHNNFMENVGMANELVSNFYRGYNEDVNIDYQAIPDNKIKLKALSISPIFNCLGFNYLTDMARNALPDLINSAIFQNQVISSIPVSILKVINENILKRILVGDAYTYMCYNNFDKQYDDYILKIENNCKDFNQIWCFLDENYTHLYNFILYASNLQIDVNYYSDVYKEISATNPNFLSTLGNINPYYILDNIKDHNIRRYRK